MTSPITEVIFQLIPILAGIALMYLMMLFKPMERSICISVEADQWDAPGNSSSAWAVLEDSQEQRSSRFERYAYDSLLVSGFAGKGSGRSMITENAWKRLGISDVYAVSALHCRTSSRSMLLKCTDRNELESRVLSFTPASGIIMAHASDYSALSEEF